MKGGTARNAITVPLSRSRPRTTPMLETSSVVVVDVATVTAAYAFDAILEC